MQVCNAQRTEGWFQIAATVLGLVIGIAGFGTPIALAQADGPDAVIGAPSGGSSPLGPLSPSGDIIPGWGNMPHHEMLRSGAAMEQVDSATLNVYFAISIVSKPGRGGMTFSMVKAYNSAVFDVVNSGFRAIGTTPGGWTTTPRGYATYTSKVLTCTYNGTNENYTQYTNFRFYDPTATTHFFPGLTTNTGNDCQTANPTGSAISIDGWRLQLANYTTATVNDRGGKLYVSAKLEDTNGNLITSSVSGSETDWKDTTGQVVLKIITATNCVNPVDGLTYANCVNYQVLQPGSTSAYVTWTEYQSSVSVATAAHCSGITDYSGTWSLPIYLVMPQYTSGSNWYYKFGYDSAGRLNYLRFPTGGVTQYTHGNLCTNADGGPDSLTKTENDQNGNTPSFSYTRSGGQTTLVRANGAKETVVYDSNAVPTDIKFTDTDGLTVRKEVQQTESGGYPTSATIFMDGLKVQTHNTTYNSNDLLTYEDFRDYPRDSSGNTGLTCPRLLVQG